ncbi:interferon gamma 1-like [Sardina pilchardus]|uniref:interferon gamma 1-like n=1 Tax=Sardina pilchardus TaxID=27697 RepID=UPI002E0F51BD
MATVAHHLKQALIWAVICLMAGEVMGHKPYFPKEMATKYSSLNKVFANKGSLSGGALFRHQDNSSQMQMLLAGETLNVYINILTNIRDKMQAKEERDDVDYLKVKMEELSTMYFKETQKQLEALKELQTINTNDEVVQRKAIYELKSVYNQASCLGDKSQVNCTHRRKRQIKL